MCDDDWLINSAVEDFLKFIDSSIQCVISNINICFENSSSNVSNYYDLQTEIVEPGNVIDSFLGLKSFFNSDYGDIHYRGSIKPFPSTKKSYINI